MQSKKIAINQYCTYSIWLQLSNKQGESGRLREQRALWSLGLSRQRVEELGGINSQARISLLLRACLFLALP